MGDERDLYQGYALQAVDKKGRLAIPNRLRDSLLKNSTERMLYIGDESRLPCMVAYDAGWSRLLKARLEADYDFARQRGEGIARAQDALANFGNIDPVTFDDAGRFGLPDYVIDDLGLDGFAFFAGAADVFHIWNPHRLIANPDVPEGTRKRCIFAMKEKGLSV